MKRRSAKILAGSLAATAAITTGAVLGMAGTSGAALINPGLDLLPTSTTVTAVGTPPVGPGEVVTIRATVGPLDLLITPVGTVTFFQSAPGYAATPIATVGLSTCLILLSTCTATTHTTVGLLDESAAVTITAVYSGDLLSKPSIGSTLFSEET